MRACGSVCRPTEIRREIEKFPSSTRPARVDTDVGQGFVKGVGNPQGSDALISELVAAELATWFGLKVPPFSIIWRSQIEIQMLNHHGSIEPPMFFSLAVDGSPRDGGDTFLSRLRDKSAAARLVIFDTWIRNWDRYSAEATNSDNLLYAPVPHSRKYDLVPIDHTHCFAEFLDDDLACRENVTDERVYGRFPEFAPLISRQHVAPALRKLAGLNRAFVTEIVNAVPQEWHLRREAAGALVELICERATYVVNTIGAKLIDDPEFPGMDQ